MQQIDDIYPLIPDADLLNYAKLFRNELTAALSNQQSSLPTILNPVAKMKPNPGSGIAVSIGGTNGYVSLFRIGRDMDIKFINRKIFSLPPITTAHDLFNLITKNIMAVTDGFSKPLPVGIGLAYPLKPILHADKFIDGELLYMTKGRTIRGLVGQHVGKLYHQFLKKEYNLDTQVVVANDAICLLVGGNGVDVSGVVGTGLNFAYWDSRSSIAPLKLSELHGFIRAEVAINIESKNFNKITGNKWAQIIDKKSADPHYSLAEKEVSGAYLYQLFNEAKKTVFGKDFPNLSSTDQLNDILIGAFKYPKSTSDDTKKSAKKLAEKIFRRSAQIVAIELCGILLKINKTEGVIPVVMDGNIFWKAKNYHSLVNLYINLILPKAIPSFARLFGSARRGIAILAREGIE